MSGNFNWMKQSIGISFHWTSHSLQPDGSCLPYSQAVEQFDVRKFTETLKSAGVQHIIFTLTHAEQYLPFPCKTLERLMPGRTTERDLLGELMDSLRQAGIRFIAYYNHSCNGADDIPWKKACGYDAGIEGDLDAFAQNICDIVGEIACRYGKSLAGWWFDSAYSVDTRGPSNTVSCNIGNWKMPWDKLVAAAKSGHSDCAVSINAGVGKTFLYYPEDYYCGETVKIDAEWPEELPDIIGHRWICIDNPAWVYTASGSLENRFSAPRFSDKDVLHFIQDNLNASRMTTFNMEITQNGIINPYSLEQLDRVKKML